MSLSFPVAKIFLPVSNPLPHIEERKKEREGKGWAVATASVPFLTLSLFSASVLLWLGAVRHCSGDISAMGMVARRATRGLAAVVSWLWHAAYAAKGEPEAFRSIWGLERGPRFIQAGILFHPTIAEALTLWGVGVTILPRVYTPAALRSKYAILCSIDDLCFVSTCRLF